MGLVIQLELVTIRVQAHIRGSVTQVAVVPTHRELGPLECGNATLQRLRAAGPKRRVADARQFRCRQLQRVALIIVIRAQIDRVALAAALRHAKNVDKKIPTGLQLGGQQLKMAQMGKVHDRFRCHNGLLMKTITLLAAAAIVCINSADAATVTTLIGTGMPGYSQTQVNNPYGMTIGPDGALYWCDLDNERVRRMDLTTRRVTDIAGSGQKGYKGDGGPALEASLSAPHELAFDSKGDLYFAERDNNVIRKVDMKTGMISTAAGKEGHGGLQRRREARRSRLSFASRTA